MLNKRLDQEKYDRVNKISNIIVIPIMMYMIFFLLYRPIAVVNGRSMLPTLDEGDVVSVRYTDIKNIERGDIVILQVSNTRDSLIKRVIGVEGDVIQYANPIDDENDRSYLYLNGELLDEDYTFTKIDKDFDESKLEFGKEIEVGSGDLYVVGDNRNESTDSRFGVNLEVGKFIRKVTPSKNWKKNPIARMVVWNVNRKTQ